MDPANSREALIEAQLDAAEGADMLMVRPAARPPSSSPHAAAAAVARPGALPTMMQSDWVIPTRCMTRNGMRKIMSEGPLRRARALLGGRERRGADGDAGQVKPGMPYLDIIRLLKDNTKLPISAYHVSGESAARSLGR